MPAPKRGAHWHDAGKARGAVEAISAENGCGDQSLSRKVARCRVDAGKLVGSPAFRRSRSRVRHDQAMGIRRSPVEISDIGEVLAAWSRSNPAHQSSKTLSYRQQSRQGKRCRAREQSGGGGNRTSVSRITGAGAEVCTRGATEGGLVAGAGHDELARAGDRHRIGRSGDSASITEAGCVSAAEGWPCRAYPRSPQSRNPGPDFSRRRSRDCGIVARCEPGCRADAVVQNALDVLAQVVVAAVSVDDGEARTCSGSCAVLPVPSTNEKRVRRSTGDAVGKYPSGHSGRAEPRITWIASTTCLGSRAARMTAVISGGTIPDRGLSRSTSRSHQARRAGRRIRSRVENGRCLPARLVDVANWAIEHDRVVVTPAPGTPARLPFWHGEYMARR